MNRRGFLKTVAGLAALAAVRNAVGDILPAPESFVSTVERVQDIERTFIDGQIFILDRPYIVEFSNTVITNCMFIARGAWVGPMMEIRGNNTTLMNSVLSDERVAPGIFVDGIRLRPGETIAEALKKGIA